MDKIGIIAFAFGQQTTQTAGPSNEAIGQVALDIQQYHARSGAQVALITQWEIAPYITSQGRRVDYTVSTYGDKGTHYITTKDVLSIALAYLKHYKVNQIIFVAHPFHLRIINLFVKLKIWRLDGFTLLATHRRQVKRIPYDTSEGNVQWWTRNGRSFLLYLFKILLTRQHGK